VLADQGAMLVEAGIWVPGWPDPEPLDLVGLFDERSAGADPQAVVAEATDLSVRLTSRPLNGADRVSLAVDGVDLVARSRETTTVVGPSGSGKSTLLEALGGLVEPTSGTVRIGGGPPGPPSDWSSPDVARAVAWAPQRAASTIVCRAVRDEVLL
ncbi:MAG: ATP-binding cassette domain-containing protein, partial [Actinomycetota bacterium]|nr:ATP-binding cassette domain-containing protein [Actinomycetota bacterium]